MSDRKNDPYSTLGVPKDASDEDIKQAYRKQAKENHPDTEGGDKERMQELIAAYSILKDPTKRKRYDETGETEDRPFDARFVEFVQEVFLKVVMETPNVENVDLLQATRALANKVIRGYETKRDEVQKTINQMEKVLKRLTRKKKTGADIIGEVMKGTIADQKRTIRLMNDQIKFMRDCVEILSDYRYEFDPVSVKWQSFGSFGNMDNSEIYKNLEDILKNHRFGH